jgi:hypothetical protein
MFPESSNIKFYRLPNLSGYVFSLEQVAGPWKVAALSMSNIRVESLDVNKQVSTSVEKWRVVVIQ